MRPTLPITDALTRLVSARSSAVGYSHFETIPYISRGIPISKNPPTPLPPPVQVDVHTTTEEGAEGSQGNPGGVGVGDRVDPN